MIPYDNYTPESIKEDIISRLSLSTLNTSEGGFFNDMISTIAFEIWKCYQALNTVIPIAFVDETSGEYIDKRCAEYGLTRKSGAKAITTLTLMGTDDTLIEAGKVFMTPDGYQFEADESVAIIDGTAMVTATAIDVGEAYNVDAGTITHQLINMEGLTSVTNTAATGGANPESDTALVERLYDFIRTPATSGNAAHYKQWAMAVDGVGDAKVTPLWDGPGTVKVLIAGDDNGPVDSTIVDRCSSCIEVIRPIGATVTVESATGLTINVAATVEINATTNEAIVEDAFNKAISTYLTDIAFKDDTIVYNRIAYLLLNIEGVIDFSSLTVNGGTMNIIINDDEVPVVGTVTVTT